MKKRLLLKSLVVTLLFCLPFIGNAQVLLTENFEYEEGSLYNQNGWVKYDTATIAPVQIIDSGLTYAGYQNVAIGKAVELDSVKGGQKLQKQFSKVGTKDTTLYVSALMNFKEVDIEADKEGNFFNLVAKMTTAFKDEGKGTEFARLYVKSAATSEKFNIGISRANFTIEYGSNEYDLNETYLVVLKYEVIEGSNNDKVSLFINPEISALEPSPIAVYDKTSGSDINVSRGIEAIELRQGSTAIRTSPNVIIDAIRISQSWGELFGFEPVKEPSITIKTKTISFGEVFVGNTYTNTINIKAENLKDDITISGLTTGEVSTSVTTISKDDAESEEGYNLTVTLTPASENNYSDKVIFNTEGLSISAITNVYWSPTLLTEVADLKALREKDPAAWATYRMNGEAIISHIYKDGSKTYYYLQDNERGITVNDSYGDVKESYKAGDKVKGIIGTLQLLSNSLYLLPSSTTLGEKISSGNEITPVVVTLAELAAADSIYESRLLKVENVTFKDVQEGSIFEYGSNPTINDGTADAKMRIFKEVEYIGDGIPREATLIGVSTSGYGNLVAPRTTADIILEQKLEVTPETIEKKTTNINVPVEAGKLKVFTQVLPGPVSLDVRGTNSSFFTTSVSTIPAGRTMTTEVTITYSPTAAGMHKATLVIDCEEATGFSKTISLAGNAIDPANMPEFTVDSGSLTGFEAIVGEQQDQTVFVTTKNLLDWLNLKVMGEGEESFRISTTMMVKNQENAPLKITFNPKKAGTFTERIEFKSEGTEVFYLTVTGTAVEKQEPQAEGDEFPLDPSNPLTLLNEKFDNVTHNKVLSVQGWKTIAVEGLRAWWGFDFKDENDGVVEKTAKVTAYDSTTEETSTHEMWLITPALDFKNSQSKMFTFRVMGNLLVERQDAVLTLHYMDMADGELYTSPIEIDMPSIPDEDEEWREYHIDLTGQEIADVFFIGFNFKATGGKVNSAVYYIDDVTYGRTDIPVITPSVSTIELTTGVDMLVNSDMINVTGNNLTEPVTISIDGANASKFTSSVNTLPVSGGTFYITFSSDQEGVHEAYVKLSSRGAADVYILMAALTSASSGIENHTEILKVWSDAKKVHISSDEDMKVCLYTVSGVRIGEQTISAGLNKLPYELEKGIYILQMNYLNQLINHKIIID